jgi:TetR/AcrR family transcriptional regulator
MKTLDPQGKPTAARPRTRNAATTRQKILRAALHEFCEHGYSGARTVDIAARAECNIRMLYHYFGNKDGLYLAALELVYAELRAKEEALDILSLDPEKGMIALVKFTFDHMLRHQEFIQMMGVENIQQGRFLRQSKSVPLGAMPLVKSIQALLHRGQKQRLFREGVDAIQLYVSILSLSYVHVSNKYTLSLTFEKDLTDADWLAARRQHVCDMVLGYLRV